jgi:epoxyqueuosine reductase
VGLNSYLRYHPDVPSGQAIIARYAPRVDYHDLMLGRLRQLLDWLAAETEQSPQSLGRAYVDTGPILERELASAAGLGWIGKNGCLIHPSFGSWLLLGELLLTIDLPPDQQQIPSRCGTCTRCIEACPTEALVAPFNLDARRCIAYLTIEYRGSIPTDLRSLMGNRVFGCDLCQEVCPWNEKLSRRSSDSAFAPIAELVAPSLASLMELDAESFRRRFAGTAITRARRRGLLRNTAVALGNQRDSSARPVLEQALRDPEPLVAEHASWGLEQLGD